MSDYTCSIDACDGKIHARGWCSRHYGAWRHHGDPLAGTERHYQSPEDALAARTEWSDGCLRWTGYKTNLGYGMLSSSGTVVMAHRAAWEIEHGPLPAGMEVDHTCWNRDCVNTEHLRLATHSQNGQNRSGAMVTSRTGHRNVGVEGTGFRVVVGGRRIGRFATQSAAIAAAKTEREARFGDFAGRG